MVPYRGSPGGKVASNQNPWAGVLDDVNPTCETRIHPTPFPISRGMVLHRKPSGCIEGQAHAEDLVEDIVVWCDENGRVCVAEAFCPYPGSYLGPAAGGRICDGRLVCPFHGFKYDATGQCLATPFADPPKTARLRVFKIREINGLIFAWWGIEGRKPQWNLPADSPDQVGWSDFKIRTIPFPGHP